MMKKLTKLMQEVIDLMKNGWELAQSDTYEGRTWIQNGGAGKGGESRRVNANTFQALYSRGLIEITNRKFPTVKYGLKK